MAAAMARELKTLPTVLTTKDVKNFLGLSMPKTLQIIASAGFPVLRLGRAYRISREQFLRWVEREARRDKARS